VRFGSTPLEVPRSENPFCRALFETASLGGLERAPEINPALLQHPDCVITPHMAFYFEQAPRDMREKAARNVLRVLEGGMPVDVVNGTAADTAASREYVRKR
jgi:lactate dehydrogenase-like 2-hydroxyacid dehydrogenase